MMDDRQGYRKIVGVLFVGFASLIFLSILFFYQRSRFSDGRLHIVFCNVGQGDAIYIRTPEGKNILIDGGPSDAVLDCLQNHMPFWDRTIHLMLLSHPHADHMNGLLDVLDRYTVRYFGTEKLENETAVFKELMKELAQEGSRTQYLYAGNQLKTGSVSIKIIGPSPEFLQATSPGGKIGERSEFASLIVQVSYGSFDALFTGDSQVEGLRDALAFQGETLEPRVEVLQVPHHGSKTGLDGPILENLRPDIAVISVGKNRYGHPSGEIIKILRNEPGLPAGRDIRIFRTDKDGEVEIVSDGKGFSLRNSF